MRTVLPIAALEAVVRLYRLTAPKAPTSNFEPNYNVAPTQIRPMPAEEANELETLVKMIE
ncbi:MAG: hypothetical protein ABI439_09060 [Rhodospirillales bacterium]